MQPLTIAVAILATAQAIQTLNNFTLNRTIRVINSTIRTQTETIRLQQEQISTLNIRLQVLEEWSRT